MSVGDERIVGRDVLERLERVESCLAMLLGADCGKMPGCPVEERLVRVERQTAVAMGTVVADEDEEAETDEEPARRFSLDRDCLETDSRSLSRAIAVELAAIERRYIGSLQAV